MTEETMREARKVFLVDTLQKLLGQDSPTDFTHKVVTVAEAIARELGFAARPRDEKNMAVRIDEKVHSKVVKIRLVCIIKPPNFSFGKNSGVLVRWAGTKGPVQPMPWRKPARPAGV